MSEPRVIFDQGPIPGGTIFHNPVRLIQADSPNDVPNALRALEKAQSMGFWLAGYTSYELGYLFSSKLQDVLPERRASPLLLFGVFDQPQTYDFPTAPKALATLTVPVPLWSLSRYAEAFDTVKNYIAAGDIYQANLTFPMFARRTGTVDDLYCLLRRKQQVQHGALVDLGGPVLLSRSPELFFNISKDGALTARPMKGTVKRGETQEEDTHNKHWLMMSEKNRAENLMIVDLLRNDIGRIAEVGSINVPELFNIETYATLHQMTSRIIARLQSDVSISKIFEALFPCGSITGAPKIRAMQILRQLEPLARDAYCGAIGWISPDGSMSFGVSIRTLVCTGDEHVRLNVGGGIVHDSTLAEEYHEALLKSNFAVLTTVKKS